MANADIIVEYDRCGIRNPLTSESMDNEWYQMGDPHDQLGPTVEPFFLLDNGSVSDGVHTPARGPGNHPFILQKVDMGVGPAEKAHTTARTSNATRTNDGLR